MCDVDTDLLVVGPDNSLTSLLLKMACSQGMRAFRLPLQRIARDAEIDDTLNPCGVRVHWHLGGRHACPVISPRTVRGVFCYGNVPRHFRKDVVAEDSEYVDKEFIAYFGFSLSQFPNVINRPFAGSLSGYTDTLPYQWNLVTKKNLDGVGIPNYDIVSRLKARDGVIYSTDFHSYTEWDSAVLPAAHSGSGSPIYLRYERPSGDPLLVWFVDSVSIAIDPVSGAEVPLHADERRRANDVIDLFRESFDLRLGQLLLFRRGSPSQRLTFGSAAPWLSFSQARRQVRHQFTSALIDRLVMHEPLGDSA